MVNPVREVLSEDNNYEYNYEDWKASLEWYLKSKGLWNVVDPQYVNDGDHGDDRNLRKRNASALHAIRISCGPSNCHSIRHMTSATEAWVRLTSPQDRRINDDDNLVVLNPTSSASEHHPELMRAVIDGNQEKVQGYLKEDPDTRTAAIAANGNTVLHVAILAGHLTLAESLLSNETADHRALAMAAINGYFPLAKAIVERNKNLVRIRKYAVIYAAEYGHTDMVRYLYRETPLDLLLDSNEPSGGPLLFTSLINNEIYDVALELLKLNSTLGITRDCNGNTGVGTLAKKPSSFKSSVQQYEWYKRWIYYCVHITRREIEAGTRDEEAPVPDRESAGDVERGHNEEALVGGFVPSRNFYLPGVKSVYNRKLMHATAHKLLRRIFGHLSYEQQRDQLDVKLEEIEIYEVLKDAITNGITEFIEEIIKILPDILQMEDRIIGRSLFAVVIVERQERIFSLINENQATRAKIFARGCDNFNNNFLHLAAKQSPPYRRDKPSGPALQMQRELRWFKAVEKLVQAKHKEEKNDRSKTPRILFTDEHKEMMKEAESWMKNIAASCMVVATLIAALMFTTLFTPPGGNNDDTGTPIFLGKNAFTVFMVSNALSLVSSTTSMLIFLGILTARFAEEDFLKVLPISLGIGLLTLFFSVVTMMVAFCSTVFVSLDPRLDRVSIPIISFAVIPITLFVFLQFPLLIKILWRTCHGGPF